MSLKAKVEAILFLTNKPIRAQAIARIINADVQAVRQAVLELIHEYEERESGLEIADEDGYSFQVKEQYASLMDEFLPVELSAALIRTLSAIAIKQPISQSEIIRVRGAGAYEHIRELVNRQLVAKKDDGRSPMLSTTKKFQEYFRLTKEGKALRSYLKRKVASQPVVPGEEVAPEDKQLILAGVVGDGVPDQSSDDELNQRIYLETMSEDSVSAEAGEDLLLIGDGSDGHGIPDEIQLAGRDASESADRLAQLVRKQKQLQKDLKKHLAKPEEETGNPTPEEPSTDESFAPPAESEVNQLT